MKSRIIGFLQESLRHLEHARSHEAAAAAHAQARESAPIEAAALEGKLEEKQGKVVTVGSLGITARTPLAEIEQRLVK